MRAFGVPEEFMSMVQVLFVNAAASVNLNGGESESFEVQRGVRQGCPLAPYLFLFVGEILNLTAKEAMHTGELEGIQLPANTGELLIFQYADDTDFALRGTLSNVVQIRQLLDTFGEASGLHMNWNKSVAFWFSPLPIPPWLGTLGCQSAVERHLAKVLGTPFGISLAVSDVDAFLEEKISRKLCYWTSIHLSLAGRAVIVNAVLLSTLWYFIGIWGGSLHCMRRIRASLQNFLWSGSAHPSRSRVRWVDVCAPKSIGGFNLVDPEEALHALAAKWVLKALTPGNAPLHLILRYRLLHLKPQEKGNWPLDAQWILIHKFRASRGSQLYDRILQAWRKLVGTLEFTAPKNDDEVLSTGLWWSTHYIGRNFGFQPKKGRTIALCRACPGP